MVCYSKSSTVTLACCQCCAIANVKTPTTQHLFQGLNLFSPLWVMISSALCASGIFKVSAFALPTQTVKQGQDRHAEVGTTE